MIDMPIYTKCIVGFAIENNEIGSHHTIVRQQHLPLAGKIWV